MFCFRESCRKSQTCHICSRNRWKIPAHIATMFIFLFYLFRMHVRDTATEKGFGILIQMTLEHISWESKKMEKDEKCNF